MARLVTATGEAKGPGNMGDDVAWFVGQQRWIDDEIVYYYQAHADVFTVGPVVIDPVQFTVEYPGAQASAYIDFNGVGEAEMSVTIGGLVYLEADTAVPASGVWTNGASAADSAASLIAAINGDTRTDVPFTAVADVSTAGVWLFWDEVGVDGNVDITTDSAAKCTVAEASLGGANAGKRQVVNLTHTVLAQELLSGAVEIPLQFVPAGFNINAFSAAGAPVYFTDVVTVETDPNRLRIATTGTTNLANTDVVHITAWN